MATATSIWSAPVPSSSGGGDYEPCPAKNQPGRVCGIFDVGLQTRQLDDGPVDQPTLVICYEVKSKDSKGQPFVVSEQVNWTQHEKGKLYTRYASLTGITPKAGDALDVESLPGRKCMVDVMHKSGKSAKGEDRTYVNIKTISAFPDDEDYPVPKFTHSPILWSYQQDDALPDLPWIKGVRTFGKTLEDLLGMRVETRSTRRATTTQAMGEELVGQLTGGITRQAGDDENEKPPF